ncbi:hypothetical protein [Salmonella enterica]|uniref:hypothetical protein n=1 Tax=Salmonella enterica TaxID=28901 RepID=UPI0009B19426|nr:hypothetical protein [Salmonella enterica]
MKVPKRKYYPLSEAAEMLGCSVNDLIFHGAHGNIELCAYMQVEIWITYNDDSSKWEVYEAYYCDDENQPIHYPEIQTAPNNSASTIDELVKTEGEFDYIFSSDILLISDSGYGLSPSPHAGGSDARGSRTVIVKGLVAAEQFILKDYEAALISGDDIICAFWNVPAAAMANKDECTPADFLPRIAGWEHAISKQNLYITISEMNKLTASDDEPLTHKQAQFIYDLLAVQYGQDVADNPRRFIDDPDSEIAKDFHDKTKKLPSGRSVERWLKKAY